MKIRNVIFLGAIVLMGQVICAQTINNAHIGKWQTVPLETVDKSIKTIMKGFTIEFKEDSTFNNVFLTENYTGTWKKVDNPVYGTSVLCTFDDSLSRDYLFVNIEEEKIQLVLGHPKLKLLSLVPRK